MRHLTIACYRGGRLRWHLVTRSGRSWLPDAHWAEKERGKKLAGETWSSETSQCYYVISRLWKYRVPRGGLCFVKLYDRYADCTTKKSFSSLESFKLNFHTFFRNINLLRITSFFTKQKILFCRPSSIFRYIAIKGRFVGRVLRASHRTSHVALVLCVPLVAGYIKHLTANFPAGDDASLVQASDLLGLARSESADRAFSCHEVLTPPDKCGRQ